MKIVITRHVPGLIEGRRLTPGDTVNLAAGAAVSLINDGYAEADRTAPEERAERADSPPPAAKRPGRPRKG